MDEEHEKAIQRNFTSLVERTDLDSMVTVLYEKGVFSEQMIERYHVSSHNIAQVITKNIYFSLFELCVS